MNKYKRLLLFGLTLSIVCTMFFPIQTVLANPEDSENTILRDLSKYSLEKVHGPTEADYEVIASFETFDQAYAEMKKDTSEKSNLVIRHQSSKSPMKIVAANRAKAMSYPFRVGISSEAASVTMNIRASRDLNGSTYPDTYINGYRLLDYFDSHFSSARNGFVAQINIAGRKGYVDQAKIDIIPMIYVENEWNIVLGGSTSSKYGYSTFTRKVYDQYYYARNTSGRKEIVFTYPNLGTSGSRSYTAYGIAPDWMVVGTRYYSLDGVEFYTDRDFTKKASNEKYYNYYQYLPVHSKSSVTASFLDNYLKSRGTSSNSVMHNLGYAFMNGQVKYDMNALLVYSLAALESGWGTSAIARSKYNLFGWNAVDTSPGQSATEYLHPSQSVDQQMKHNLEAYTHVSKNATGNHFRGPFFGNKGNGFNLKYASDPYWGLSMSSIAFQLDKANGFKDWGNYRLAILKDQTNIPVRKNLNSTDTYYTTPGASRGLTHQTMIIVPDAAAEANGFYKVHLITPMERYSSGGKTYYRELYDWENDHGYVAKEYVTQVAYGSGKSIHPVDPPLVTDPVIPEPTDPTTPISPDTSKYGSYKITATAGLRLRSGASTSHSTITTIPHNISVKGLLYNSEWYAVVYNGNAGFVSSDWVEETKTPATTIYEVTGNGLNVRLEPTTSANSLGTLNIGDTVQGVVYDNNWTWFMYNGQPAFVSSQYLKVGGSTPTPTVNKTALKTALDQAKAIKGDDYTTASFKALQTAISAAETVYNNTNATQAQVNTQVTALNGAISNLVKKPVETTLDKYRITANPNLRVRSQPTTSSTTLGSLNHNTIVEAKPVGDGSWLQITYNGKTGYISAQYTEKQTSGSVQLGDINGDGRIGLADLNAVVKHLNGTETLTGNKLVAADINKDGRIGLADLNAIVKHLNGTSPINW